MKIIKFQLSLNLRGTCYTRVPFYAVNYATIEVLKRPCVYTNADKKIHGLFFLQVVIRVEQILVKRTLRVNWELGIFSQGSKAIINRYKRLAIYPNENTVKGEMIDQ